MPRVLLSIYVKEVVFLRFAISTYVLAGRLGTASSNVRGLSGWLAGCIGLS